MSAVDNITVRTDLDPYLSLKALSAYAGLSIRTLRMALTDPVPPLPHYRPGGGKVLIRRSDFDQWMTRFRQDGSDLERLVSEITKGPKR